MVIPAMPVLAHGTAVFHLLACSEYYTVENIGKLKKYLCLKL